MFDLDATAARAARDPSAQEALIRRYRGFILRCACTCCKRYVTDADDEWSVALAAFAEALGDYSPEKGAFLHFAELVIRRRLTDHFRRVQKFRCEIPVSPAVFSGEADDVSPAVALRVQSALTDEVNHDAADEIAAANAVFSAYGFSFFDLAEVSPKSAKTKDACAKAAVFLLQSPARVAELQRSKQLPLVDLVKNTGVPRKILERHRKYIIAVVEMLSGEYPCLADYLRPIREELSR